MNEFRRKLLGIGSADRALLRAKEPRAEISRAAEEESFADLTIPREAQRASNHRDSDRHRLDSESAVLLHGDDEQQITLINLSGGGAMIEGAERLKLWDRIELRLGDCHRLEAIVRWVKGNRIGLEFAHETRIELGSEELAGLLRAVIRRSFPDIALTAKVQAVEPDSASESEFESEEEAQAAAERELRHPLIWTGLVHFNHDSTPVRLRNISSGGAMIEGAQAFPVGADLLLDLGEAGAIFASVHWALGDQAGLRFHAPYDVNRIAKARPEIASARWVAPDYLREDRSGSSPWSRQWDRSDLGKLHRALERPSRVRKPE